MQHMKELYDYLDHSYIFQPIRVMERETAALDRSFEEQQKDKTPENNCLLSIYSHVHCAILQHKSMLSLNQSQYKWKICCLLLFLALWLRLFFAFDELAPGSKDFLKLVSTYMSLHHPEC